MYGDTRAVTHLRVLDSLDGKPSPKWSGLMRKLKIEVSWHPLFLDLRIRALVSPGERVEGREKKEIPRLRSGRCLGRTWRSYWRGRKGVTSRKWVVGCYAAAVHLICRFQLFRHRQWPGGRSAVPPQLSLSHLPPPPPPLFECQHLRQMLPQT